MGLSPLCVGRCFCGVTAKVATGDPHPLTPTGRCTPVPSTKGLHPSALLPEKADYPKHSRSAFSAFEESSSVTFFKKKEPMHFSFTKNTSVLSINFIVYCCSESFRQAQKALKQCTGELKLFLRPSKHYNNQTSLDFFNRSHTERLSWHFPGRRFDKERCHPVVWWGTAGQHACPHQWQYIPLSEVLDTVDWCPHTPEPWRHGEDGCKGSEKNTPMFPAS